MKETDSEYLDTTESTLRIAEGLFPDISDLLRHIIKILNIYFEYSKKIYESTCNDKEAAAAKIPLLSHEPFQINCYLATIDHLLMLSENVEKSINLFRENNAISTSELLIGIGRFDTLFRQFTLPEPSWIGEDWDSIDSAWHDLREKYLPINKNINALNSSSYSQEPSYPAPEPLTCIPVKTSYGTKKISVVHGDLCKSSEKYDIVVCSAWKKGYMPTRKTLIGSLLSEKNISVCMLAKDCELDFSQQGAWLSKETKTSFNRIACIELLDYSERNNKELLNLKSVFSTLSYIIEQAAISGISVKRIALPILGTGRQMMDSGYILGPLVTYCLRILQCIEGTEEIVFYEIDEERAYFTADRLNAVLNDNCQDEVFISYSSKQYDIALKIYNLLTENSIKCWMAPQSIPAGSQYYLEIPKAINSIKILLLLLTQDAVNSRFVPKEVSASLGAGKLIIPLQVGPVKLENGFDFLLEGEQIRPIGDMEYIDTDFVIKEVNRKLIILR